MSIKKNFDSERNLNGWLGANRLNSYLMRGNFPFRFIRISYAFDTQTARKKRENAWVA